MASISIEPKRADASPSLEYNTTVSSWLVSNLWIVLITGALIALLYRQSFVRLVTDWINDPNYTHGFVVPLASLWIIWSMRGTLEQTTMRPRSWGLLVVALALLQLLAGTLGAENFVAD